MKQPAKLFPITDLVIIYFPYLNLERMFYIISVLFHSIIKKNFIYYEKKIIWIKLFFKILGCHTHIFMHFIRENFIYSKAKQFGLFVCMLKSSRMQLLLLFLHLFFERNEIWYEYEKRIKNIFGSRSFIFFHL